MNREFEKAVNSQTNKDIPNLEILAVFVEDLYAELDKRMPAGQDITDIIGADIELQNLYTDVNGIKGQDPYAIYPGHDRFFKLYAAALGITMFDFCLENCVAEDEDFRTLPIDILIKGEMDFLMTALLRIEGRPVPELKF